MKIETDKMHWLLEILQTMDVGLVVLDREYKVQVWNSFMENHSGQSPQNVQDNNLFDVCPDISREWFQHKIDTVFLLGCRAHSIWEERPYVFKFQNYRPVTGGADFMYQYTTLIPLKALDGSISHVCIIVYDVTDIAVNRMALQNANASLEQISITDQMTQLYNRAHWEHRLEQEFKRGQRTQNPTSVVMFDIDHFKKVNDTYGHQPGDEVIRVTSKTLHQVMRETDIAGRYGGEEFGVVLVDTNAEQAMIFAERLRTSIENLVVETEGHQIKFTISIGISELKDQPDYQLWLKQSDIALYAAKHAGRNKALVYSADMKEE